MNFRTIMRLEGQSDSEGGRVFATLTPMTGRFAGLDYTAVMTASAPVGFALELDVSTPFSPVLLQDLRRHVDTLVNQGRQLLGEPLLSDAELRTWPLATALDDFSLEDFDDLPPF